MNSAHARLLHAHETPGPADILIEHTRSLPGLVIRAAAIVAGSLTRVNHVGRVCEVHHNARLTVEAHAGRRYRLMSPESLRGSVLRVRQDPDQRQALAGAAVEFAPLRYNWMSIIRIALWTSAVLASAE